MDEEVDEVAAAFAPKKAPGGLATTRESDRADALARTWESAWEETYEGTTCPKFRGKDGVILRATLKAAFPHDVGAMHDFLDFAVRNWRAIRSEQFGWMVKSPPPEMPTLQFLCHSKFSRMFVDAYAERRRYTHVQLAHGDEAEVARMMHAGMTREEAIKALGDRQGASRVRQEVGEVRKHNTADMVNAQRAHAEMVQAQKDALRAKRLAAENRPRDAAPPVYHDLSDELPPFHMEPFPPFDPLKWN